MKVIKVDKPKTRTEYRAYLQTSESRSFPFPDGVARLITLKTSVWESFDWYIAQDGQRPERIAEMAYEIAQEDILDNMDFSFEEVLQERFKGMVAKFATYLLIGPQTLSNID